MRRIVLVLALTGCEDAEPMPSPFETAGTSTSQGSSDDGQDDERHQECLDLADCVAKCGLPSNCGTQYWLDYECADMCRGSDEQLESDAAQVAMYCDICPGHQCADESMECGR